MATGAGGAIGTCSLDVSNSSDGSLLVATIRVSQSTNTSEIDVAVYADGSADRTLGPARFGDGSALDPPAKAFAPGSPEVVMFLCDLATVGDVSAIPADPGKPSPTLPGCAKSGSFGTITTVTAGGNTSGDLQCLDPSASAAAMALAHDCDLLTGRSN